MGGTAPAVKLNQFAQVVGSKVNPYCCSQLDADWALRFGCDGTNCTSFCYASAFAKAVI
jgi:hypothetical protein